MDLSGLDTFHSAERWADSLTTDSLQRSLIVRAVASDHLQVRHQCRIVFLLDVAEFACSVFGDESLDLFGVSFMGFCRECFSHIGEFIGLGWRFVCRFSRLVRLYCRSSIDFFCRRRKDFFAALIMFSPQVISSSSTNDSSLILLMVITPCRFLLWFSVFLPASWLPR